MAKHEKITAEDTVQICALGQLYLHHMNPRQEVPDTDAEEMGQSIATCGLIQSLAGLQTKDGIGIVAGGRRLRGLKWMKEQGKDLPLIHVKMAPDNDTAILWASAENEARKPLDPVQQIIAFRQMKQAGASAGKIAAAFNVTEANVYKMLALADLDQAVFDAMIEGLVSVDMAKSFTAATDQERVKEALELIKTEKIRSNWQLKEFLIPDSVRASDRRVQFVGVEAYEAAGGQVSRNLFEDSVELVNTDILDRVVAEKLEDQAAPFAKQGWSWVEVCESSPSYEVTSEMARVYKIEGALTQEQADEAAKLEELYHSDEETENTEARRAELDAIVEGDYSAAQKALAGGYVYLNYSGEPTFSGGFVRSDDLDAAIAAGLVSNAPSGSGGSSNSTPTVKPKMNQALTEDMKRVALCAEQTAILEKSELLIDLLAFSMCETASGTGFSMFSIEETPFSNKPTTETGLIYDERLTPAAKRSWDTEAIEVEDKAEAFIEFQKQGKKHRNAVLTAALARNYCSADEGLQFLISEVTGASVRKVFTPTDENFFKRVTGPVLEQIYIHIMEDQAVPGFAKMKKGEKVTALHNLFNDPDTQATLDADAKARRDVWTPAFLEEPTL